MARTYNLFISHSWGYSDSYNSLVNLLNSRSHFPWLNYSVPLNDPIHGAGNDIQLREAIRRKMAPASVIIILAGVYSTYSKWINIEIDLAVRGFLNPKPILAIEPFGAERTSKIVKDNADEVVKWNTEAIVAAIRRLA